MPVGILAAGLMFAVGGALMAQSVEARHWQGAAATTRQPEHVVAGTMGEWRALWSRVGLPAPDMFEPGRMNAVGIFLGRRNGEGYAVNILSTSRRRDRIVVVFEERMPAENMLAQRSASAPRPVAGTPPMGSAGATSLAPAGPGSAGFAAPGTGAPATSSLSPPASRPTGQPTSPWAIILIHRADLPVSVEQRLFR
ncbi:MAG: hypothetical protein ACT4O6_19945 [Reyranella sp.]